jgi:hypothetical protein
VDPEVAGSIPANRTTIFFQKISLLGGGQLLVLTLVLVLFSLLDFIPFLGRLVNLAVTFLGLGAPLQQRAATLVGDRPAVREPAVEPEPGSSAGEMTL